MTSTTRNRSKKALNLSEISENNQSNLLVHDANTYGNHIMRSTKTYNSTNVKNLESNNCNKFQSRKKYITRQQSRLNNVENEEIISNDKKTAVYGKHKNYHHSKNNESITKGETKFENEEDWKDTINQDDSFLISAKDKNLLSSSKSWKVPNCDFPSGVNKKVTGAGIFDCSIQLFMEEKSYCFGNDKSKDYSDESGIWLEKMSSFEECDSLEMKDSCQQLREKLYSLIERLKIHCHHNEKYSILIEIIYCCTEKLFSSVSEEIVPEIISTIREMDLDSNLSLYVASLLYIIAKETAIPNNTSFLNIIIELIQGEKLSSFEKLQSFNKDADGMIRIQHLFVEENYNVFDHYLACDFALESLLKFVAKAQDDWYKKKFRHLGGLDIVVDIVNSQCKNLWNEDVSSSIQIYNTNKLGKCLNILQNAIFKNPDNQTHILNYKNAILLQNIVRILQFCRRKLSRQNFKKVPAKVYLSCLSAILKLLVNITHKNVLSSMAIGDYGEVMDILLYYIISLPLLRKEFDIMLLLLGFLTNLIICSKENLYRFIDAVVMIPVNSFQDEVSALEALTELFQTTYKESQRIEAITERLLYKCAIQSPGHDKSLDDNASRVFHSADHHMEHTMICAHIALILGYAIEANSNNILTIKKKLSSGDFVEMTNVLKEFHDFVRLTNLLEDNDLQNIQRIVDVLSAL